MKKFYCLIICLILSASVTMAQEKPVAKLFQNYIKELNDLNKTKDIKRVLAFFDESFRVNQTYIGITGKVSRSTQNISTFAAGLQGLLRIEISTWT